MPCICKPFAVRFPIREIQGLELHLGLTIFDTPAPGAGMWTLGGAIATPSGNRSTSGSGALATGGSLAPGGGPALGGDALLAAGGSLAAGDCVLATAGAALAVGGGGLASGGDGFRGPSSIPDSIMPLALR
jgi:hypothetical protein